MKKGFTLIELIVAVSIIGILSAIILPNYRAGERQFLLQGSAHQLAQDLRRIQEMAMSIKEVNGLLPPRYGLEFDITQPNSYIFFVDANDNGKREPVDPVLETKNFEKGIIIQQLFADASPKTELWVTFKPPDPRTQIREPAGSEISIGKIQLSNGSQTKTIVVNKAGLIYIE